jgi:cobalt-zinc-cadmium efflux system protein
MAHSHQHHSNSNIRTAFLLNLSFTILEIIGGTLTNSVAILSDALHDLGDSISLGAAWYLENFSKKAASKKYSYGYGRFSLLGALINALVLIIGSVFVLAEAIPRLMNPEQSNATGMIIFAFVGIAVNGVAAMRLKDEHSMNARVVALHLMEDVLGWVAVLVVGVTLLFVDIPILDPILSVLITLYVLYNVVVNFRKTIKLFLQGIPDEIDLEDIEKHLLAIEGVSSAHNPHVWSLDGEHHVLTIHLIVPDETDKNDTIRIKHESKAIAESLDMTHITVEIEYECEECILRPEA